MVQPVKFDRKLPFVAPVAAPRKERQHSKKDENFASTISKAPAVAPHFEPSKPVLDLPLPAWKILESVNRMEPIATKFSLYRENQIDKDLAKIQKFHHEEALKLEEAYKASKDVTFWGILQDLGSTVMGAASFFFGGAALSAGGGAVMGGVLIASGVASIGSVAFKYANGWDWIAEQIARENKELKSTIITYLPPAVGVVTAALGIYGAYGAWNCIGNGMQSAISIAQTTGHVANGLIELGNGHATYYYKNAEAQVSALQTMSELTRIDLEYIVEDLKEFHKKQMEIEELAGRLIQETDHAIQITQQPA